MRAEHGTAQVKADDAAWRAAVERVLKGGSPDTLTARTRDGLPIAPLYPADDAPPQQPLRDTGRPFAILSRLDHPEPDDANVLARAEREGGAAGLALVLAGTPEARGFGLRFERPADIDDLLAGLPVQELSLRLDGPADGAAALRLARWVENRRLDPANLDLDFGLDPLAPLLRGQTSEWEPTAALLGRTAETLRADGFRSPLFRLDARPVHEGGGTETQELAWVLAAAVTHLRCLELHGFDLEAARNTLSVTLAADGDILLSIAKLRAVRRLWASLEAACGLAPRPLRLHAETAWRILTRRDPATNMLRNTLAAVAALLGGADSLTVLPHTAALGLPDEAARRLARNTGLILTVEAGLDRILDPLGGSGAVEALTEGLCDTAWSLFGEIERQGGLPAAIGSGWWPEQVATMARQRRADLASGSAPIVGTTLFRSEIEALAAVLRPAPPEPPLASAAGLDFARDAAPFEAEDPGL